MKKLTTIMNKKSKKSGAVFASLFIKNETKTRTKKYLPEGKKMGFRALP